MRSLNRLPWTVLSLALCDELTIDRVAIAGTARGFRFRHRSALATCLPGHRCASRIAEPGSRPLGNERRIRPTRSRVLSKTRTRILLARERKRRELGAALSPRRYRHPRASACSALTRRSAGIQRKERRRLKRYFAKVVLHWIPDGNRKRAHAFEDDVFVGAWRLPFRKPAAKRGAAVLTASKIICEKLSPPPPACRTLPPRGA